MFAGERMAFPQSLLPRRVVTVRAPTLLSRVEQTSALVTRGLDPRVHLFRKNSHHTFCEEDGLPASPAMTPE
jgi:hypothetical protein